MKHLIIFFVATILFSCGNKEKETPDSDSTLIEDYEKIDGQVYRAYYGGNNQLKMEGQNDSEGRRHGVWTYYTVDGKKQSVTEYQHGKKDGYSIVYHPNGALYYRGEYRNDEMVGEWDYYNPQTGEKTDSKNYGYPKQ